MLKTSSSSTTPQGGENNWIIVHKEQPKIQSPIASIVYPCKLMPHSPIALVKCWDSLAFIVRNVAHITPYNFDICVRCLRTFVEATMLHGGHKKSTKSNKHVSQGGKKKIKGFESRETNEEEKTPSESPERYDTIAIQLTELMHTLYSRIAQIFRWWAEESGSTPQCTALWSQGWCPLLQGIARICTDHRYEVRKFAISYLQRSLLSHDLQPLTGPEWVGCFRQVLFPLMNFLLTETYENNGTDPRVIEESRIEISKTMSKFFLNHLTSLMTLPNFNELWIEILQYLEKFMKLGTDMLYETVYEILKNMLRLMHFFKAFHNPDGVSYSPLWELTWNHISTFLPSLREEIFMDNGE
jgi:golgi-specific brefeldin A-resistance guanine nucleotide exchange factor 1